MPQEEKSVKVHCNKCGAHTNHNVEHSFRTSWEDVVDDDYGAVINGWEQTETLRCLGCDTIHLREASYFSEDSGPRGEPVVHYKFVPARFSRQKPGWVSDWLHFDKKIEDLVALHNEIYRALAEGSRRLAAMGIRALVEQIMIDKVGDKGRFEENIKAFFEAGFVAPVQQSTFRETLIEAGHAAMHRGFNPSVSTIETLLDIVEPLVDDLYFKQRRAREAAKSIPKRS